VQPQPEPVCLVGERADLVGGVQRAELRGLRDGDDAGLGRCSSPKPQACFSTSSGVSLPSGVGTVSSLSPATRSGAPFSSVWMCAVSAQITAPHGGSIDWSDRTLAPVPLNTGYAVACAPKWSATTSCSRAV